MFDAKASIEPFVDGTIAMFDVTNLSSAFNVGDGKTRCSTKRKPLNCKERRMLH